MLNINIDTFGSKFFKPIWAVIFSNNNLLFCNFLCDKVAKNNKITGIKKNIFFIYRIASFQYQLDFEIF